MMFPYLNDILSQPSAMQNTLDGLMNLALPDSIQQKLIQRAYPRIILTGMGSSYHALHPLFLDWVACGLHVSMVETSELIYYSHPLITPDSLVILLSQSGSSAETVRLLEKCSTRVTIIGITNNPGSPLGLHASACIPLNAGEEHSVSCKTYLASLAALRWLEDQAIEDVQKSWLDDLHDIPRSIASYLAGWKGHIQQLKDELTGIRVLYLVGRGASLATAGIGGLTIKESTHFPAEGMSSAAFRHGPYEMVSPETYVIIFQGIPQTESLNIRLYEDIKNTGGRAGLVSPSIETDAFHFPPAPTSVYPILETLPVQMISLALAELQGITPGNFRLGSKVTITE